MCVNRAVKRLIVLVLGGVAVVAAAQSGTPVLAAAWAGAGQVSAASGQASLRAVPPMLAALRPLELAEMRRAEAQQGQALFYRLLAGARYSSAEMNVFAAEGYVRS
jgi:hypothetical protein